MQLRTLAQDYASAIQYAQDILDRDTLREDVHRELMRLFLLNGQRALAPELLIIADAVRGQGRFERLQPQIGEPRRLRQGGVEVVTRVGVGPMKTRGRECMDQAHEFQVIGRRLRRPELDVEILVARCAALLELRLRGLQRRRLYRPRELHFAPLRATEQPGHAFARALAPQVVAGKVDRRFAKRLTYGKGRPDGAFHAGVHRAQIGRVRAEHRAGQVLPEGGFHALHGFVGPGLHGHRLPPALQAVVVGQAHQHRGPHAGPEELELADEFVIESPDLDTNDLSHVLTMWLTGYRPRVALSTRSAFRIMPVLWRARAASARLVIRSRLKICDSVKRLLR